MNTFDIATELKQQITSKQAFHYRIIPFYKKDSEIHFKTDSNSLTHLQNELEIVFNIKCKLFQDSSSNIDSYLARNYRKTSYTASLKEENFLNQILHTAKDYNSSDIHIETYETECRIRYRMDGKLKEQYNLSKERYPQLINKIKIEAGLDISQKRLPQDGRISIKTNDEEVDIRVSTMPTLYGEKIVLRLLKRNTQNINISTLGFRENELKCYMEGIKKPNGIILISGPTGSGKTTTLYGTLKLLNKEDVNIVTIEDPIEYTLEGINQVQLNEGIGLDFSSALRTFLRQDPDIIMVGEIRDHKTATMAIKAALTGHLVLSTIHTNSAWATISRLLDMNIPPYLIASTLNLSVAQRLVRVLCNHCKEKTKNNSSVFPDSFKETSKISSHYLAKGCSKCFYTGYQGRKAIYEVIPISYNLEKAIKQNHLNIESHLTTNNIKTLKDNAIQLINEGFTSVEEAYSILAN